MRQGRASVWVPAAVDFSDLSSEYLGILYEGLLDFELKTAPPGDPVVFLAVDNQPALPLSRLEGMDDKVLGDLLEKMKDTAGGGDEASKEDDSTQEGAGKRRPWKTQVRMNPWRMMRVRAWMKSFSSPMTRALPPAPGPRPGPVAGSRSAASRGGRGESSPRRRGLPTRRPWPERPGSSSTGWSYPGA